MTSNRASRGRRFLGNVGRHTWVLAGLAALAAVAPGAAQASTNPLASRGMWIWVLSASNGGSLSSIEATAHRYGLGTLMIKSGDGSSTWSQFNSSLVRSLHASHLRVCAWQYVYGNNPGAEARVGAAAVHDGADCLIIDAESQYEGKYVQAQTYINQLRKLIGSRYPVALAGFPYVDYHPAFPYSIFLGPGGAQYNAPQMYWVDIGTTVDTVYSHTYTYNRVYGRPIDPLGQVYNNPPARQILRFRQLSRAYRAQNVSWWDWQESGRSQWQAVSRPVGSIRYTPTSAYPILSKGDNGDLVVWAQLHLVSAGEHITVDGGFGPKTQAAVKSFQQAHGLTNDGVVGPATWQALLRYAPAHVTWTSSGAHTSAAAASAAGPLTLAVPKSARLRAKRYEIPAALGSGRPAG